MNNLIENIKLLKEMYNIIDNNDLLVLEFIKNKISLLYDNDETKLSVNITLNLSNLMNKIKNKLNEEFNKIDFTEYHSNNLKLESLLYEIENEPYFNKKSLDNFKNQIKS